MFRGAEGQRRDGADLYPWLELAWSQLGAHERPGPAFDPQIHDWAEEFGIDPFDEDKDPYCALYPRWCIHNALPNEPLPAHPTWSLGWLRFGIEVGGRLGSIAVFYRGRREQDIGHVGFYLRRLGTDIEVLGANQSDSVSVARVPERRLLACRWPATWNPQEAVSARFSSS